MHESQDGASGARMDRRGFLGWAAFAMTGIVAVCGGVVALIYAAAPALRSGKATDAAWSEVPDAHPAETNEPTSHAVAVVTDAGWAKTQAMGAIFLDRGANGQVIAYSARCPHEGCAVDWRSEEKKFICPCHGSSWTRDGQRLGGPTRRGLDPLDVRPTASGGVEVRYVTYALDSAERIQIG
jgi:Rieske Fe-S protein